MKAKSRHTKPGPSKHTIYVCDKCPALTPVWDPGVQSNTFMGYGCELKERALVCPGVKTPHHLTTPGWCPAPLERKKKP